MTTPRIYFFAQGIPKGQPRPRAFAKRMGNKFVARVYDAGTAEGFKGAIALAAKPFIPETPIAGPVRVLIDLYFPRPKNHSRSNGELKPDAPKCHTTKPDAENVAKAVLDALTALGIYKDDSQVWALEVRKRYADDDKPGANILIEGVANG